MGRGVHVLLTLPILDMREVTIGKQRIKNVSDLVVKWPEKNAELLYNIACIDAEIVAENANRHVLLNLQSRMV